MKSAFKRFDLDDSGTIDYGEFESFLKLLDIGISDRQICELMCDIDQDGNTVIDLAEFAGRFEMVRAASPRSSKFVTPTSSRVRASFHFILY